MAMIFFVLFSNNLIPFLIIFSFQGNIFLIGTHNAARKVIDGISYVAESLATVSSKPTKVVTDWVADQIAPEYWVPNSHIKVRQPINRLGARPNST